ncbi:hypothetical protein [Mechercharimyces sp. CAU 1602]|uniref:hypothetical protein n=1 Tax=Mechercharimyces sp. CAU 1602 TaxID=2973933 RepID=UPI002162729D|nr:hypothetical protein [Mechercharimyces sp. CAU 1602]MCS1351077.1 hypothetical protein [Mechercharimyces sp. CAU 1602]
MEHPSPSIRAVGQVSTDFLRQGITTFDEAKEWVCSLPYQRILDPSDPLRVITERRGTCSSKHALLAFLAKEMGLQLPLMLGIYRMNEQNTPGVGRVLRSYQLAYIPEAHCYVKIGEKREDYTRQVTSDHSPFAELLYEEEISPDQIGQYKVSLHQRFLREWSYSINTSYSFSELWQIREACIASLSMLSSKNGVQVREYNRGKSD